MHRASCVCAFICDSVYVHMACAHIFVCTQVCLCRTQAGLHILYTEITILFCTCPMLCRNRSCPVWGPSLGSSFPFQLPALPSPGSGALWGSGWFRVVFAGFAGRAPAFECQVPSLLDLLPGYHYALTSSPWNPQAALLIAALNCN